MRIASLLATFVVSGTLLAGGAAAQESSITGTITLHGCVARASDFVVQAAPTSTVDPSRKYSANSSNGGSGSALVFATDPDGRHFGFEIRRLSAGQAYLLDLRFNGKGCDKIFWRGLTPGRVFPGAEPARLEGFAARTRLEILGEAVGRSERRWVGADHLDFMDPVAGVRKLRVQTDLPGITRVALQIATEPFPTGGRVGGNACETDDDSVIRRLEFVLPWALEFGVDVRRGWVELPPIDFNELVLGGTRTGDGDLGPEGPSPESALAPLAPSTLKMLQAGAPLYLRAIPMSDDGSGTPRRRCNTEEDGVPGWVKIARVAASALKQDPGPPPLDLRLYSAVYKGPTIQPWPGPNHQYCVRAVQDYDVPDFPLFWLMQFHPDAYDFVTAKNSKWSPGGTIHIGDSICYGKSSGGGSSWLDVASGLVTGFVDGAGLLVDSASRLWESVKQAVVNIAADVITAVGVPCDATCKGLLMTGVNIAMTSAGIPPTLPNVAAIKQGAIEYAAAQIADQSPVPGTGVLAEHAISYAVETLERYAKQGGGGSLPSWLTMDLGLVPATLTVRVERGPQSPGAPDFFVFRPPSLLVMGGSTIFDGQSIALPRRFWTPESGFPVPGTRDLLKVPIVLQPNLSKVPPLQVPEMFKNNYWTGVWNKQHWAAGLGDNPCAWFPFAWWQIFTAQPYFVPMGSLGILATPTLVTADFNGPLPVPAIVSYCK